MSATFAEGVLMLPEEVLPGMEVLHGGTWRPVTAVEGPRHDRMVQVAGRWVLSSSFIVREAPC